MPSPVPSRSIGVRSLRDKMLGAWVGQMAGVAWGAPTEFFFKQMMIPEGLVPTWNPDLINSAYLQDDLYVEVPFLEVMDRDGIHASWTKLGDALRDAKFPLWHANWVAQDNLRKGIVPPESGHYLRSGHAEDIDWQIEADFIGIIAPGMLHSAMELSFRNGHVMGYGDGVYGGVWIAAMRSEAYFASSVSEIVAAGIAAIPPGTTFRAVLEDVVAWHGQHPNDYAATWDAIEAKWGKRDHCPDGLSGTLNESLDIDAKLNAAYVMMGLLYGEGDFEKSVRIAMRGGQDSDCNASSVGGILGTLLGFEKIPTPFKSKLVRDQKFLFTEKTLDDCIALSEKLARQMVVLGQGTITGTGDGETWTVPLQPNVALPFEQWPSTSNAAPALAVTVESSGLDVHVRTDATDSDGIRDVHVFYGDVSYAAGADVAHRYARPGTYELIVWAADRTGNTSHETKLVTVK